MVISVGLSALATLHVLTPKVLLIVAAGIAVSSLDDFALDLIYFGRRTWRAGVVYRRHRCLRVEDLPGGELGWMASIVPA
jgi:adsorption protein B